MKSHPFLFLAAAALALAGCSTPTKVDHGPIQARTFSFVSPSTRPEPEYADKRQAIHTMIQDSITKNLAARGVTRVATGGDVTVGYLVIVGNNATTASINTYFGYNQDDVALHDKAHDRYTGSKNPNYFEAGTLVIDLIDSKTFKLLNRGHATRPLLRDLSDQARAERLQGVVDEILRNVRISP